MDEEVRNPGAVAAIVAVVLALVSAFLFFSHVMIFVFPIMPLGAWLGWQGRSSGLRTLGLIASALCGVLTVVFAYLLLRYLLA